MRTTAKDAVSVKLSPEDVHKLDRLRRARGLTRSELIRRAIRDLPEEPAGESFLALAGDLCGLVKDAPADLATNPRYLDDLGRS